MPQHKQLNKSHNLSRSTLESQVAFALILYLLSSWPEVVTRHSRISKSTLSLGTQGGSRGQFYNSLTGVINMTGNLYAFQKKSCSPGPQMQPGPAATHAEASADPRPQALPAAWQDPRGHRVGSRPEGQAQEPVETHIWGRVGHRCPRGACAHGDSRWQGFPRQGRHASHCGRQTKGPAPRRDHRGERWGQAGSWESLAPGRTPASVTQAGPHRGADAPGQAEGLTPR